MSAASRVANSYRLRIAAEGSACGLKQVLLGQTPFQHVCSREQSLSCRFRYTVLIGFATSAAEHSSARTISTASDLGCGQDVQHELDRTCA